jgi:hypothetical protein
MFRLLVIPLVVGIYVHHFNRIDDARMCSLDPQLNEAQLIYVYVEPTQIVSTNYNLHPYTSYNKYVNWKQNQSTTHPFVVFQQERQNLLNNYAEQIIATYKIPPTLAHQIVDYAYKHRRTTFPQTRDIIAIVGIESSFKPRAKSSLTTDPAIGLMQIRSNVWRIPLHDLYNIEKNVFHGADILEQYYRELGNRRENAVQAYNIGITAFREGGTNLAYLHKYKQEVVRYNRY